MLYIALSHQNSHSLLVLRTSFFFIIKMVLRSIQCLKILFAEQPPHNKYSNWHQKNDEQREKQLHEINGDEPEHAQHEQSKAEDTENEAHHQSTEWKANNKCRILHLNHSVCVNDTCRDFPHICRRGVKDPLCDEQLDALPKLKTKINRPSLLQPNMRTCIPDYPAEQ